LGVEDNVGNVHLPELPLASMTWRRDFSRDEMVKDNSAPLR